MRTLVLVCLTLLVFNISTLAQAPFQMNYQGVARDPAGLAIANQVLRIRVTIRSGSALGPAEYAETRAVTTNRNGLFNFAIGSSGALYSNGVLSGVNWAAGNKYMQVEMDAEGNNNYVDMGATQLLSVPYALYALQSGSDAIKTGNGLELEGSMVQLGNKTGDSTAKLSEDREIPLSSYNLFMSNGRLAINTKQKADGFLTIESGNGLVPSLLFRSAAPGSSHAIMVHKASESSMSGTALDWSFNMQDYRNVQPDGLAHKNNTVYQYGWNITPWGDRADHTRPAFLHSFEQRYTIPGYGDCSEYHVVGINKQGQSRRHWSVLSSHDGYNSYQYWVANAYLWHADNAAQSTLMSLSTLGTVGLYGEDAKIDFKKNLTSTSTAIIRQMNSAGTRYYGLLGLNSNDDLLVGSSETPIWMPNGMLNLGGYNKTYGAIYNRIAKVIHVGTPENTGQPVYNSLQVNGMSMDLLKLKAWQLNKTWSTGIDEHGNYYISDADNNSQRMIITSNGGIVIPQLSTLQRNSIAGARDGEMIFNTDAVNEDGSTGVFEFFNTTTRKWARVAGTSKNISNADLSFSGNRIMSGHGNYLSFTGFGSIALATINGLRFNDQLGKYKFENMPGQAGNTPGSYLAIDDSGYVYRTSGSVVRPISKVQANIYTVSVDDHTLQLSQLTQTSQLNLPEPATCKGRMLVLSNANRSMLAKWKVNLPISEFSKTYTVLPNESNIQIQSDGQKWVRIN